MNVSSCGLCCFRNTQNVNFDGYQRTRDGGVKGIGHSFEPNNLSVVSDSDQEDCSSMQYTEVVQQLDNISSNNIPTSSTLSPNPSALKGYSDSGRSSLRDDHSPYIKRLPFQSFLHRKSASIDDSGHHSQDEEIAILHSQSRNGLQPSHSNSFSTGRHKPDIFNVRATEGPPIRMMPDGSQSGVTNSGYIAEAPEGFRSTDSYRAVSPHSRTSDYESNTPTPEITSGNIIDYCADLPTQLRGSKQRLPMMTSGYSNTITTQKGFTGSRYFDKVIITHT